MFLKKRISNLLDSAESQNLVKNNLARSANLCKSFCYFWLLPKVESPLSLNPNLPNNVDSAFSQNLVKNTLRGSILEIKSGFCETSDKDKTKVYRGSELKQSPILARKTLAQQG